MAVIETEGLTKSYGRARGIEDVTFQVDAGEVFGFLGPNGAGKTTTIRTLLDFLRPTRGSARIFGLDSHRDSVTIRGRLGNLPGDFGYGKQATGREVIALLAQLRGVSGLARAESLAQRFRADLDRPLGQLSRGNRQKVGLIQAAFHEPELLILDEPTGGLDPLMQEEFLSLVAEDRERGATIFFSSHELDEIERVCDRVGIVGIAQLSDVEHYLQAEMLSLIVPLALGYLAVRAIASGLAGAAEEGSLEVLLSAPLARWRLIAAGFTAAAVELATVLVLTAILTMLGSLISDAGLSAGHAAAGFAEVWPLALLFAGLGAIACGFSLRTAVVTGSVAGVLVTMYLIDLIGKLDPSISGIRYVSVFKYYGKAIDSGIDPVAFVGITAVAIATAAVGALLFERRDLAA